MKFYALISGNKLAQGYALDERSKDAFTETLSDGEYLIECSEMPRHELHYWDGRALRNKPVKPAGAYYWDDGTKEFVYNLESGMAELRSERNKRLSACDWTQAPDAPVDQAAWATYRQALRDLPQNTTDPREVVWPTPPQ